MPRKRRSQDGIETLLTFRPCRLSVDCLQASLESLVGTTELPHAVHVVVQGAKGRLQLPNKSSFPFLLRYTLSEDDTGDCSAMARSLLDCKRRYWSYLPGDVILHPGSFDTLFRCLRNEDRRKEYRAVGATLSCIADLKPPRQLVDTCSGTALSTGGFVRREERFAAWSVTNYVPDGPLVLVRFRANEMSLCFDERFKHGGHLLDLCMQAKRSNLEFLHIEQPATQLNLGCIDTKIYEPLPETAREVFLEKWGESGKQITYMDSKELRK